MVNTRENCSKEEEFSNRKGLSAKGGRIERAYLDFQKWKMVEPSKLQNIPHY